MENVFPQLRTLFSVLDWQIKWESMNANHELAIFIFFEWLKHDVCVQG